MQTSSCRLGAVSGETIELSFTPVYRPATAGSSAWSIIATDVRFQLHVPVGWGSSPMAFVARFRGRLVEPNCVVKQLITLQPISDHLYGGESNFPLLIQSGSYGMSTPDKQFLMFDRLYQPLDENAARMFATDPLTDPVNGTGLFQVNMFAASPYASLDQELWNTV